MKTFKTITNLKKFYLPIVLSCIISVTFQSAHAQQKSTVPKIISEVPTELNVSPIYFQEWYAGIEVGGTGINVFAPLVNHSSEIEIDRIYFRNLEGKLIKKDEAYFALLENPSKLYTFKKIEKPDDYPFELDDYECVISYIEHGKTKYFKVKQLNEKAGIYYENGPPTPYVWYSDSKLASNK